MLDFREQPAEAAITCALTFGKIAAQFCLFLHAPSHAGLFCGLLLRIARVSLVAVDSRVVLTDEIRHDLSVVDLAHGHASGVHAKKSLVSLLRRTHLGVAPLRLVLRRWRGRDQRRIHDRAAAQQFSLCRQVLGDALEDCLRQIVAFEQAKVWTVPADRMKAGKAHRVPLTARALAILDEVETLGRGAFVFPGQHWETPLSEMALEAILRRLDAKPCTVHGFRSSFRDWAGECTGFPREIAEAALSHAVGDAVERAYRRGDALERRRELMEAWARFCEPEADANVVPLRKIAGEG